jgi:hypothetical protein
MPHLRIDEAGDVSIAIHHTSMTVTSVAEIRPRCLSGVVSTYDKLYSIADGGNSSLSDRARRGTYVNPHRSRGLG